MKSLWRKQCGEIASGKQEVCQVAQSTDRQPRQQALKESHRDVIVIGAGLAGLLIAYYLKEQGKNVLVLEAKTIASGQTERTTAKITSQHGVKYSELIKKVGVKKARLYAQANEAAIREYEMLIKSQGIECQFQRVPAYLYSLQETSRLRAEAEAASSLGIDAFFTKETELPFEVAGAVCFRGQAQFDPLAFVRHIASTLEIREHTKVTAVKGHKVITQDAVITADKIVVATHYPVFNVPGFYFVRLHQERSYVLALSGCDKIQGMYYGVDKGGLSFRQAGEYLLLGGSSCRTGENDKGTAYDSLVKSAQKLYPDSKEETRWAAQDCMPHDGIPFIGRYSVFTPHLYVVTGFQKWGMTSSMIAAMILRDAICGNSNPYERLFSPQRVNLRASMGNLMHDVGMSVKGLTKGTFYRPSKGAGVLACGHGGIVTIDGRKFACYRDETGKLHKMSARCPHLGCELSWNPDEKSWDCPCHGSRFDVDGKLLDNPSKTDAK